MPVLHISQDETGYWQLTLEGDDGSLTLISHQFSSPDHLIDDARDLVAEGKVPGGVIVIGPPQTSAADAVLAGRRDYQRPEPRKVPR